MSGVSERFPLWAFQCAVFFSLFGINLGGGVGGEGSLFRQLGWLMLAGFTTWSLVLHPGYRHNFWVFLRSRWLAVLLLSFFCLMALASVGWSEAPLVTFKRAALLMLVFFLCFATVVCAQDYRLDVPSLLLWPLLLLLGLSVLFSAVFPGVAFTPIGWQGMTGQKNEMGQLAALLVMALWLSPRAKAWPLVWRWTALVAAVAALGLSRSGTATLGLGVALLVLLLVQGVAALKRHPTWVVPTFLGLSTLTGMLFVAYLFDTLPSPHQVTSGFFGLLGKSETLTGRTALWDLVLNQSRFRSEWIGGGYGGFWDISYERVNYIISKLGFRPIQAHNGYLDIFNDLGYLGLSIALATLLLYAFMVLRLVFCSPNKAAFHAAFCAYLVLVNFSESTLFRTTQFLNLLFAASLFWVAGQMVGRADEDRSPTNKVKANA